MPKVKVPHELKKLAEELYLHLDDYVGDTEQLEAIIARMKDENEAQRVQENEHRDDIDRNLDAVDMPTTFYSPVRLPEPFELVTYLRRLGWSDERVAALMFWAEGRDQAAAQYLTPSELRTWYEEEAAARAAVENELTPSTVICIDAEGEHHDHA